MAKKSTVATLLVSTAAAGLCGAVIAGAKDSSSTSTSTVAATTPNGYPGGGPGGPGGRHGHGGPGRGAFGAEAAAVAKSLGVTESELKKAVEAARPGKTDAGKKDRSDRLDEHAAALAKELGENTADVKSVIESLRPAAGERPQRADKPSGTTPDQPTGTTPPAGGPGGRGPGGPGLGHGGFGHHEDALVTALAKKFSISEDKAQAAVDAVQKAHETEREAKQDEFFAAVAKSLGKSTADVKKAFEAARPTPPAKPTTK